MQTCTEGSSLKVIKAIYDKPTVNIMLHGEKLNMFTLKSWRKQRYSCSILLFSIVLKFLAKTVKIIIIIINKSYINKIFTEL